MLDAGGDEVDIVAIVDSAKGSLIDLLGNHFVSGTGEVIARVGRKRARS